MEGLFQSVDKLIILPAASSIKHHFKSVNGTQKNWKDDGWMDYWMAGCMGKNEINAIELIFELIFNPIIRPKVIWDSIMSG